MLQRVFEYHIGPPDNLTEGIEVADHEIDRGNAMSLDLRQMLGQIAPGKQAAVNRWMKRFDPSADQLRKSGHVADRLDRHAGLLNSSQGPAGRDQLESGFMEPLGQSGNSRLIPDAK